MVLLCPLPQQLACYEGGPPRWMNQASSHTHEPSSLHCTCLPSLVPAEWGYSLRVVDLIAHMAKVAKKAGVA